MRSALALAVRSVDERLLGGSACGRPTAARRRAGTAPGWRRDAAPPASRGRRSPPAGSPGRSDERQARRLHARVVRRDQRPARSSAAAASSRRSNSRSTAASASRRPRRPGRARVASSTAVRRARPCGPGPPAPAARAAADGRPAARASPRRVAGERLVGRRPGRDRDHPPPRPPGRTTPAGRPAARPAPARSVPPYRFSTEREGTNPRGAPPPGRRQQGNMLLDDGRSITQHRLYASPSSHKHSIYLIGVPGAAERPPDTYERGTDAVLPRTARPGEGRDRGGRRAHGSTRS